MLLLTYTGSTTRNFKQIIVSELSDAELTPQSPLNLQDEAQSLATDNFSWFPTHNMNFIKRQRGRPKKTDWNTEVEPGVRKVVGDQFDDMEMVGETHRNRIVNEFKKLVERGVQIKRTIQVISDRYELPYVQVYGMVEPII